jgi:uncharacterized protein (TIGR02678 family)
MSQLQSVLEAGAVSERAAALRHLLAHPLTLASDFPDMFASVLRHRAWLNEWFADHPGWKLAVEPSVFARLHKVSASSDATRGARLPGRSVFDRRRYALLCLVLAACDEVGPQTTLATLAHLVEELSTEGEGIAPFDATSGPERRAFVDALRLLVGLGVLRVRDGDTERYAQSREGDALLDVNERALAHVISAPTPPAFAGAPERLLHEALTETEEGQRLRHRQHAFRRLLDDPVLYFEDLEPDGRAWVDHSRGFLYSVLEEEAGFTVERRAEGLAVVDPSGDTTDTSFPDGGSTSKHAAILLAEQLVQRRRAKGDVVELAEVVKLTRQLHRDFGELCHWSKQYPADEEGCTRLAADALELLESFGLVQRNPGPSSPDSKEGREEQWRVRPALARFRPSAPTRSAHGRGTSAAPTPKQQRRSSGAEVGVRPDRSEIPGARGAGEASPPTQRRRS